MKTMKNVKRLGALLVMLLVANGSMGQAITIEDVIVSWDKMTNMVVELAKLMPSEHYDFSPGEPLRNFAAQINHTSGSTISFSYAVNAGKPSFPLPDRNNPPLNKKDVVDLLEKSFRHFRKGLESLSTENLSEEVGWGPMSRRKQITRLKAILIVASHMQREHGKTMMYLRAKGIKPAPAGSW